MFLGNKKCRIYAACSVSQTPNFLKFRKENHMDSCDSNGRSRRDGQNQTMNSNHAYQTVGLPQGLFECESGCLAAHFRLL